MRFFAAAALSFALAFPAASQNLVTNGTFDTSVSGWGTFDPNIVATWSPLDADGSTQSGSLLLTNQDPNGLNSGGYQCVGHVTPGQRLDVGGKVRTPSGGAQGQTWLIVFFLAGANCGGAGVGPTSIAYPGGFDVWDPVQLANLTVPAGAASAKVQLSVVKNFPGPLPYQSYFDDLFVTVAQLATLTIPASASIHGQNGTFFQTDLQVMNLSKTAATTVSARHRCFFGQTCGGATPSIALGPRETKTFTNVLASLFGDAETAGAIELTYDAAVGAIAATSRTYTPALPAPTYGTGIPGLASTEARTATMFVGLANNGGNLSGGFRTNAGAYNPNASAVNVTYTLLKPDGTVLGTTTRTLGPNEAQQVNDVFGAAGAGLTVTTAASLQVTSTLAVFPHVTVIDNQSSDQVYAQAFPDPNP